MCLCCMHFRAPHAALKQKNSPNMLPIISSFQGLLKFMQRHLLAICLKQLNAFSICYRRASFVPFFYFQQISGDICFPSLCGV